MNRFPYTFLTIIVAACVLVPLISYADVITYATVAITMLSGLCGIATLYIALVLYDRYGFKTKTSERTLNAINALIGDMQKVCFIFLYKAELKNNEAPSDYVITLSFQSNRKLIEERFTVETLSGPLLYKQSGAFACSQLVEKHDYDVFLPKSIAEKIRKIRVLKYDQCMVAKDARTITMLTAYSDKIDNNADTHDAGSCCMPKENYSVTQFLDVYFNIRDAILL